MFQDTESTKGESRRTVWIQPWHERYRDKALGHPQFLPGHPRRPSSLSCTLKRTSGAPGCSTQRSYAGWKLSPRSINGSKDFTRKASSVRLRDRAGTSRGEFCECRAKTTGQLVLCLLKNHQAYYITSRRHRTTDPGTGSRPEQTFPLAYQWADATVDKKAAPRMRVL